MEVHAWKVPACAQEAPVAGARWAAAQVEEGRGSKAVVSAEAVAHTYSGEALGAFGAVWAYVTEALGAHTWTQAEVQMPPCMGEAPGALVVPALA